MKGQGYWLVSRAGKSYDCSQVGGNASQKKKIVIVKQEEITIS